MKTHKLHIRQLAAFLAVALILVACSGDSSDGAAETTSAPEDGTQQATTLAPDDGTGTTPSATDTTTPGDTGSADPAPVAAGVDCDAAPAGEPWTDGPSVQLETLQEPGDGQAGVTAAMYPHPDYAAKLWSQWGQGIVAPDGRVLSALGDHGGVDANSFIYVYDPADGSLTEIAEANAVVGHTPGDWGVGKMHAQMVNGPCGDIYTSTYWGTDRDLTFTDTYQGSHLVRIDPVAETIADAGLILPEHGVASMASYPPEGLLYAEGRDPFGQRKGPFLVIDTATGETIFNQEIEGGGFRTVAVDTEGRAYISWNESDLAVYDPATNTLTPTDIPMPGGRMHAITVPDADGVVYGVTQRPDEKFALHPDGTVTELGTAMGYVTSTAMDPDGSRFFYMPHAHGGAFADGAPIIAVDTTTGAEEVVVELNDLFLDAFGVDVGGTYNVSIDPSGDHLYVGVNVGPPGERSAWGDVAFVDIALP